MESSKPNLTGPEAIVHLSALVYNYRQIKKRIGNRPLMAVVKANGYGHGAVEVAKTLEEVGAEYFAVFTVEEARELRQNGIRGQVFLFSRLHPAALEEAVTNDYTLNISWPEDLNHILDFIKRNNRSPRVHIKIDTGMSRLGIPVEDMNSVFSLLKEHPEIRIEGIYSHYATADEGDLRYAKYQLKQFENVLAAGLEYGINFKFVHFSNSGTVLNLPESYFDMIRVGMLLYGAYPSDEVPADLDLKPVMEFTGPIVTVRRVPKGTPVSYGGVYTTERETNIAVIQTGFADGFPRSWYKKGYVMYKGEKYPVAGRVCMDQLMVDFGDAKPSPGERVLFWGENSHGRIMAEEISQKIESTPYVLFTGIHGRTARIYVD